MVAIHKIAFFCGFILLVLLSGPTVTAFDGRAVQFFDDGVSLSRQGHDTEAIALYDKALVFEPNYADAWTHRGFSQSKLGQYSEAVASYDRAIAINPNSENEELWSKRGAALSQLGRYAEAITSYDRATAINPYDEDAKQNREIARGKQRQAEQVQQQTKKTPLMVAPISAIILISAISVWSRRQDSI